MKIAAFALGVCALFFAAEARADATSDAINAAYKRKDYATVIGMLTPMATNGEPNAQLDLCRLSILGIGVPKDYNVAAQWQRIRKFLNQGFGGLPPRIDEALKWYHLAAEKGYPLAEYGLGALYMQGRGVAQDYTAAAAWFRRAAEQNNSRG